MGLKMIEASPAQVAIIPIVKSITVFAAADLNAEQVLELIPDPGAKIASNNAGTNNNAVAAK